MHCAPHLRTFGSPLVSALLWIAVTTLPSAADALTVFDFNDFPADPGPGNPNAVNTTVYGCDGKSFCTNGDINDARENAIESISTTRNGIDVIFTRPPRGFPDGVGILPFGGGPGDDNFLEPGNIAGEENDYLAYVADFSKAVYFAEVDIAPFAVGDGDFAFLELWSGPGATGTLVERDQVELDGDEFVTAMVSNAVGGQSIKFGIGLDIPGCESGCFDDLLDGQQGFADDIGVEPIPEPSAAVVFATGLLIVARRIRRKA